MSKISFDELLAKREQREAARYRVGAIPVPGTDRTLEAIMPGKKVILDLYGEFAAAETALQVVDCGMHALYACCPQLQDRALHAELGVEADPMGVIDALFTVSEQDALGGAAMRFMQLIPSESPVDAPPQNLGLETVKN